MVVTADAEAARGIVCYIERVPLDVHVGTESASLGPDFVRVLTSDGAQDVVSHHHERCVSPRNAVGETGRVRDPIEVGREFAIGDTVSQCENECLGVLTGGCSVCDDEVPD
jgi:hypothetical protein